MKKRINKRGIYLLCSCVFLLGLFVMNHNIAHAYTEELITNFNVSSGDFFVGRVFRLFL